MKRIHFHFKPFLPLFVLPAIAFVITIFILQPYLQEKPVENPQTQKKLSDQDVLAGETIGCFSGGWGARKKISFNNASSATLTNFPVLVKLDANRINYAKTKSNGGDLKFEDPSSPGTALPYEIETWNPSGASYVWVKVPQIDVSTSDYIWMYYNNPTIADGQQRTAVWDASYKGVWHLGSIFYDSTSNGNNGTNHNTTPGVGLMGSASIFAGTSTADQYVSIPHSDSLNISNSQNYTLEAWVNLPADQNTRTYPDNDIISKWNHDTSPPVNPYPYNMRTTNSTSTGGAGEIYSNRYDANGVNPNCSSLPNKFNNNSWTHVALVKNGLNMSLYINGASTCSTTDTTTTITTNTDPLHFGRRANPRNWLTGSIDEVRLSNTNRSAEWIKAAYNTSRDTMNTFGAEELCQSPVAANNPVITSAPIKTPTPIVNTTTTTNTTTVNSGGIGGQTVAQSGSTTNTASTQTTVDRLASQDPTAVNCISSLLSPEELNRLRYLQPKIASEQNELNALQERVKVCFQTFSEVVKIQEASKKISELPQATKQCVVNAVGLNSYDQIQNGSRQPSQQEIVNSQSCFAAQPQVEVTYQTKDQPLNTVTDSCLVLALGTDRYNRLKTGQMQQTLEDREKIKRCFGTNPNPLSNKVKYALAPEIESCMKTEVSQVRLQAIRAAVIEPSEEEKAKVNQCFSKLNDIQSKLLPPPPQQIPYLKQDIQKITISNAAVTPETTSASTTDNVLVVRGKSTPNTLVSVYVFSDPIVIETVTDKNGDWVYKMNDPLERGSHLAYATIRSQTGEQVRSSVFNFEVAYAAVPTNMNIPHYFAETTSSEVPTKFIDSSLIMVAGSILLAIILILIVILRGKTDKGSSSFVVQTNLPSGQSKGENGPRPIN